MTAPTIALSIPELDGADTLTVALALAACGIYVGPSLRGEKYIGSVLGKDWQYKTSRDPKVITGWFAGTDYDLCIHCGRSGLVVLDVDRPGEVPADWQPHLDKAPYQPTRPDTPRRGHYIFAMPPGRMIGNPVFPWGEVRGLNGLIVVFPSHHVDGGRYGPWLRTGVVPVLHDVIAKTMPDATDAEDAATDAQVDAFLAAHTAATRPEVLDGLTKALKNKFAAKLSRHGSTVPVLVGALKESRAGYYPAMAAYDAIRPMFLNEVSKPPTSKHQNPARTGKTAANEFYGILAWAVGQANAADLDEVRARVEDKMPDNNAWIHNVSGNGQADPAPVAAPPIALDAALAVFKKWLHIDDPAPVLAVAAAVIANLAAGEPVWLLIVGPPSGGKTEILSPAWTWTNIVPAATITEAALLSGTAKRDRAKNATGGLLRQIGDFGILLAKDFTSVLSPEPRHRQSRDGGAARSLRRPLGPPGRHRRRRVLHWHGKCGFIGGVTPSYDRYSIIVNTLGDRYLLLRMPEVNAAKQAQAALAAAQHEQVDAHRARRQPCADSSQVPTSAAVTADLTEDDVGRLVALAIFAARARTAVERDGYTRELQVTAQGRRTGAARQRDAAALRRARRARCRRR